LQLKQVANEETVLAVGFFIIVAAAARSIGSPYSSWANGHIERITNILQGARQEHTQAITERMDSVKDLKEVVPLTQNLYAVAKVRPDSNRGARMEGAKIIPPLTYHAPLQEIAELEHKNFQLEQENAVKSELKQVLDSWVRYEQQQRESEQLDLVKTVKAGVEAELAKPAFKKQLLEEALAHVEGELRATTPSLSYVRSKS
jgi:F-type H+-transporting ATPase subunit b